MPGQDLRAKGGQKAAQSSIGSSLLSDADRSEAAEAAVSTRLLAEAYAGAALLQS